MADPETRYRKLAAEYAKLKSHLPVLKKAVLDGQDVETRLKEEIKEKEQCIRKSEQELESLVFRNDQLSKRVMVLQDELQALSSQSRKKGRSVNDTLSASDASVLSEELHSKITENERLNKELSHLQSDTSHTIMELRDKIDTLEYAEKQHSDKMSSLTDEHTQQVSKLRESKAMLEVRLNSQERAVRESKLAASIAEDRIQRLEKEITAELNHAKRIIETKIPFNDTSVASLNAFNVPTHNRKYQLRVMEQLRSVCQLVREFSSALTDLYTYWDQRIKIYPCQAILTSVSPINVKFGEILGEAPATLKSMSESFARFQESVQPDVVLTLDTACKLDNFADRFEAVGFYVKKVLPYLALSLKEEDELQMTSQAMVDCNTKLMNAYKQFCGAMSRTSTHLSLLASQSANGGDFPKSNQPKMLRLFSDSLAVLHQAIKGLGVAFNRKSEVETPLPTAPSALPPTDKFIIKALLTATTSLSKLSKFMTDNYEGVSFENVTYGSSLTDDKYSPMVAELQSDAAAYLKLIQRPVCSTVPYEKAVENMKTLLSSTESRVSLDEQVSKLQTKVSKLEQEKEHWLLEAQLLKIKYDKLRNLQGVADSPTLSASASTNAMSAVSESAQSGRNSPAIGAAGSSNHELGELVRLDDQASDEQTRETLLRTHYEKRIEELTSQLQLADSKTITFHAECRALTRHLEQASKARSKAHEELNSANSQITQLQDELITTKKSYDAQLMTMSDALASMNGNLASQQDEIEELKIQLKMAKKGKR